MDDSVAAVGWDADGFVASPIFGLQPPSAIDIVMMQMMSEYLAEKSIQKLLQSSLTLALSQRRGDFFLPLGEGQG